MSGAERSRVPCPTLPQILLIPLRSACDQGPATLARYARSGSSSRSEDAMEHGSSTGFISKVSMARFGSESGTMPISVSGVNAGASPFCATALDSVGVAAAAVRQPVSLDGCLCSAH